MSAAATKKRSSRREVSPHDALAASLDSVRAILEGAARARTDVAAPVAIEIAAGSPFAALRDTFRLSPFEIGIIALAAAVELQPGVVALLATCNGDPARPWPTFGLALALLPDGHWDAFAPGGALRARRLIVLGEGDVLVERAVRLDERVLHALLGVHDLDPRIERRVRRVLGSPSIAPSERRIAEQLGRTLGTAAAPHVHLWSTSSSAAIAITRTACGQLDRALFVLDANAIPADPGDRDELARLWDREAALSPVTLLLDLDTGGDRALERLVVDFALRVRTQVVLTGRETLPALARPVLRIEVERPDFDEQLRLWQDALRDLPQPSERELRTIAAQFRIGAAEIESVAEELRVSGTTSAQPATVVWQACRARARPRLGDLAQRVTTRATLDDLVLPEIPRRAIEALLGHARQRALVEHAWGFSERGDRGTGTSALFAGPSGTGKTMAAEVIASAMSLDLYRIDLSAVVSKYIGETEQNLRRVFDAAESGGAVLLFDEADALFGRRTEVKDSHDRHANIEVSYLLQRMEAYGGLAILTTNLRDNLDDAFLRRIPFVVDFPFPDAALREQIWRGIFPAKTPCEGLDFAKLARLAVAGGNVRSIARNAAYLAADSGGPVTMRVILQAARLEYTKLGRSLSPDEVRGWIEGGTWR